MLISAIALVSTANSIKAKVMHHSDFANEAYFRMEGFPAWPRYSAFVFKAAHELKEFFA